ncbi:MAG: hypothetical protein ACOYOB_16950 [Myxococcota bacterium]
MDPDFLRELIVLGVTVALYIFGTMLMLRGHTVDLSAAHFHKLGDPEAMAVTPKLNKRRKAIARDAERRRGPETPE